MQEPRRHGARGCRALVLLLALAVGLAGCRRALSGDRPDGVEVLRLEPAFSSDRSGEVRLALAVPGTGEEARVVRLTWQLRLSGRPFGVGAQVLDAPLGPEGGRVEVVLPLLFAPQPMREGRAPLAVEVRGTLEVEAGGEAWPLPFHAMRVVRVEGAPLLHPEGAPEPR